MCSFHHKTNWIFFFNANDEESQKPSEGRVTSERTYSTRYQDIVWAYNNSDNPKMGIYLIYDSSNANTADQRRTVNAVDSPEIPILQNEY